MAVLPMYGCVVNKWCAYLVMLTYFCCDWTWQVMAHPWFNGVDWGLLEAKDTRQSEIVVPYSLQTDFLTDLVLVPTALTTAELELSSAESIDPENDAKYFADF